MAAIFGILAGVAEIGAFAQTTECHCAYIDWLNRPKKTGFVDELLGPIDEKRPLCGMDDENRISHREREHEIPVISARQGHMETLFVDV